MAKNLLRTTLLFLLLPFVNQAFAFDLSVESNTPKYKSRKSFAPTTGSFLLSAQTSLFHYGGVSQSPYYGISGEYYFYNNWSVRGGVVVNPAYFKFTPAPFTAELLHKAYGQGGPHHYSHGSAKGFFYLILSLAMNDGVGYNFPIGKYVHLMPYIGTWQCEMQYTGVGSTWKEEDHCSMGMCLKVQPRKHLVIDLGGEYNRSVLFSDSLEGYRMSVSVGYKFS